MATMGRVVVVGREGGGESVCARGMRATVDVRTGRNVMRGGR